MARKSGCLTVSLCTFVYYLLYSLLCYHVNYGSMIPYLVNSTLHALCHESWQVNELRVIATTGPPKEAGRDLLPARARLPTFLRLLIPRTRLPLRYRSRPPLVDYTFARVPETRVKPRPPSVQTSPTTSKSAYCLRTLIHPLKHPIFPTTAIPMLPLQRLPCSPERQLHFICLNSTSTYRPCLSLHSLCIPGPKRIQRVKSSCH
jgi:hypothetical protein